MSRTAKSSYTLRKIEGIYYYDIAASVTGSRRLRGSCRTDKEAEAHAIALKIVNQFKQENIYGKKPTIKLGLAVENYWLQHAQNLKSAHNAIQLHCKELLSYFGKDTYIHEIGIEKLYNFRSWKKSQLVKGIKEKDKARLVSTTTVNRVMEVYRAIYFMAKDDWKVEVPEINFKKVFFPKKDRQVEYLRREQIEEIIRAATEQHTKDMIRFAFMTGLRWANVSGLRWADIDMDKRIIRARIKSQKEGGQLLYFEIYEELFAFLKQLPTKTGYVFTRDGLQIKSIRRSFATACKACEITLPKGQNIHILRHSSITYLLEQGVPAHIVKDIVGHSNITTTMRYTHVVSNIKRNALNEAFKAGISQKNVFDNKEKYD